MCASAPLWGWCTGAADQFLDSGALEGLHWPCAMNEFANLLVRASHTMGTLYALAVLLNAEPREVYYWIAGLERPSAERMSDLRARLNNVL